ncbi:unnamed protein product [Sphagnum balticum]
MSGEDLKMEQEVQVDPAPTSDDHRTLVGGSLEHCDNPRTRLLQISQRGFSLHNINPVEVFKLLAKYVPAQYKNVDGCIRELVCTLPSGARTAADGARSSGSSSGSSQGLALMQEEEEEEDEEDHEFHDRDAGAAGNTRFDEEAAISGQKIEEPFLPGAAAGNRLLQQDVAAADDHSYSSRTLVQQAGFAGRCRRGFETLRSSGSGLREVLDWQEEQGADVDDAHGHEVQSETGLRETALKMAAEDEENEESEQKEQGDQENEKGRLQHMRSSCRSNIESMNSSAMEVDVFRGKVNQVETHVDGLRKRLERAEKMVADLRRQSSADEDEESRREELRDVCVQKEEEKRNLQGLVNGLQELCMNHEKSINGLRQALKNKLLLLPEDELGGSCSAMPRNHELHRELYRLSGVEVGLRRELESAKREIALLRCENQSLIARLRAGHEREAARACAKRLDQELRAQLRRSQAQVTALQEKYDLLASRLRLAMRHRPRSSRKELLMQEDNKTLRLELARTRRSLQVEEILLLQSVPTAAIKRRKDQSSSCWDLLVLQEDDPRCEHGNNNNMTALDLTGTTATHLAAASSNNCEESMMLLQEYALTLEEDLRQSQAHCTLLLQEQEELRLERYELVCSLADSYLRLSELEKELNSRVELMKELEVDLDRSTLQIQQNRKELSLVTRERDELRKEGEIMSREALHMSLEVELLRRRLRQLDEELLLKDGQISILRSTWEHHDDDNDDAGQE